MWEKISRTKLVMLILCTACITIVWRKYMKPTLTPTLKPTNTCSCLTCISDKTFLMERNKKSVAPFLSPLNNITQEDYQWWRSLQLEKANLTTFKNVKKLFFTVFPNKTPLLEPDPDRCQTCAVVGNSGNMKGSNYGSQIDSQDVVIRINEGITAGFEADVGTRTTHRVMYPESATDLDNNTHLILFPFKIMDIQWIIKATTTGFSGRSYAPIKSKIKVNKNLVMVVNPAFMSYVHTSWLSKTGRYPSTGFMTVILALHICDQVNVFGFGADKNGNWHHYWEELKNKHLQNGVHPGRNEYDMIQKLAKQNKLIFHKGSGSV